MEIGGELEAQSPNAESSTIEIIRDFTVSEDSPVILVNPAHGNEPYIMGTAFAIGVSKKLAEAGMERARIVVPLMYGDRQRKILLEENPKDAELIHFDEKFGEIIRDITFGNGDFSQHLRQVNSHYDDTQRLLRNRFSVDAEALDLRSLSTGESSKIKPRNIIATIDTAPRVSIDVPLRYFAFPILVSEVLKEAMTEGLGFDEAELKKLISRMLKVEAAYSQVFIPLINPTSYRYAEQLNNQPTEIDGRPRIFTPPMKRESKKTTGKVPEQGIYVMFSGTESNKETIHELAKSAQEAGLRVYSPPWVDVEDATKVSPDVLNDENIIAVFGRSGWGTGWQVQNLALPWIVNPYESGDDPEIYFNNKTVEALRMGKVLSDGDLTPDRLNEIIKTLSAGVTKINDVIRDRFGTQDGIDFVSSAIAEDYLSKRKSS